MPEPVEPKVGDVWGFADKPMWEKRIEHVGRWGVTYSLLGMRVTDNWRGWWRWVMEEEPSCIGTWTPPELALPLDEFGCPGKKGGGRQAHVIVLAYSKGRINVDSEEHFATGYKHGY